MEPSRRVSVRRIQFCLQCLTLFLLVVPRPADSQEEGGAEKKDPVSVSGVVTIARSGERAGDAELTLLRLEPGQSRATDEGSVETDSEGAFVFDRVEPGRVFVRARFGSMAPAFLQIDFDSGEPLLFELKKPARMQGYVFDETTGRPLEGATVGSRLVRRPAVTNAEGFFDLRDVSPYLDRPTHTLDVQFGDYLSAFKEVLQDDEKEILDAGEFRLKPGAAIEFSVRDEAGEAIANPRAMLYRLDLRRFPGEGGDMVNVRGDESGKGRFGGLVLDAPFVVQVAAEGYPSHVFGPFRASSRQGSRRFEWVMTEGRDVGGEVVDEKGQPIAGASVHGIYVFNATAHYTWDLPENEQGWNAVTDDEGKFRFEKIPYGNFMVEVRGEGRRSWRGVLRVERGGEAKDLRISVADRVQPEPPGVGWAPSFARAFERAQAEQLPVFVFMTMDGEVANEYHAAHTYQWEAIRRLTRHTVPLLSTAFDHGDGDLPGTCSKYGSIPCSDHQGVELIAGGRYLSEEASSVPQHVFLRPSGRKIEQRMFYLGFEALRNMIVRAVRTVNPERALVAATEFYPDLIEGLRSEDEERRAHALRDLLLLTDHADEMARTALLAVDLRDYSPSQEIEVLSRYLPGSAPDRDWFVDRILETGSRGCRAKALNLLAVEKTDAAFETLARALEASPDRGVEERVLAAMGVEKGAEGLVRSGLPEKRLARVAIALARRGRPAAIRSLFEILTTTPNASLRNECALSLLHFPPTLVLPRIEESLEGSGPARTILARVAGDLGDPRAVKPLLSLLEDTSLLVRTQAARSLGRLGSETAIPGLRTALGRADGEPMLQVALAASLVDLGVQSGVPVLIGQADHPVLGFAAQEALKRAYAAQPPRFSSEWRRWWESQQGGR